MNAPRDPQRVITTTTFGAMVLAPQVVAVWNAAIRLTESITGRRSGIGTDELLRGRTASTAGAHMSGAEQVGAFLEFLVEAGGVVASAKPSVAGDATKAAKPAETATEGTATIRYYKNSDETPHWTVETKVPGQPDLDTHQVYVGNRGASTEVQVVDSKILGKPIAEHVEPLPRADRARSVQEFGLERVDAGPFVRRGKKANSCATFVCQVVSGGRKLPVQAGRCG